MISAMLVALLVLVCAASDRIIGWGEFGRTKPVIVTVIALAVIVHFLGFDWKVVVSFPLAFLVWRTPGWGFLGGSINPAPTAAGGTFLRHLLTLAFLVPAYFAGLSLIETSLYMVIFALLATTLAVINYYDEAHANQTIETLRGMILGGVLSFAFVFPVAVHL